MFTIIYVVVIVCFAPLNGQVDCDSGLVNMGLEGDNCTFSCDPGYILQESVISGTCESTGSWSGGMPSCIPLNCSNLMNFSFRAPPSCRLQYQSQCTVSCDEGFTGDGVTYLCNVISDSTMVDWVPIGGVDVMCEKGLLFTIVVLCITFWSDSSMFCSNEWSSSVSKWSYYWSV